MYCHTIEDKDGEELRKVGFGFDALYVEDGGAIPHSGGARHYYLQC